jgi:hypothetical protein
MFSIGKRQFRIFGQWILPAVISVYASGCAEHYGAAQEDNDAHRIGAKKDNDAELRSAHCLLGPNDVMEFRQGRSKTDILKVIQWRGDFGMTGPYEAGSATAISYVLFSKGPGGEGGEPSFAIFVDDKFAKFIKWFPFERIQVPYEGTTASRYKPIPVGDISWLIRAVNGEPIDISELEKEVKARPETPSHIDPGLTAAYLLLKSAGLTPAPATEKDYKRNAELRDQFNGARVNVGMSPTEVEAIFKAKPLESGKVAAGNFRVYGSDESFDIAPEVLYSNVLVVFKDEKAGVIYGIEGGSDWREKAQERFSDFAGAAK